MSVAAESSGYVLAQIRGDWDRHCLRGLLLDGAESEPESTADAACFNGLRLTRRPAGDDVRPSLVYVAATRAKKELLVLSFGTPSRLL